MTSSKESGKKTLQKTKSVARSIQNTNSKKNAAARTIQKFSRGIKKNSSKVKNLKKNSFKLEKFNNNSLRTIMQFSGRSGPKLLGQTSKSMRKLTQRARNENMLMREFENQLLCNAISNNIPQLLVDLARDTGFNRAGEMLIQDQIRVEYLNRENIHALLYVLENNNDLDYLSIEKIDVMSTAQKLANALKTNSTGTLKELSVIDTDGYLLNNKKSAEIFTKELANALKTNNTLETLYLHGNNISDDGITCLGDALKVNKTLKSLNLSRNKIGDVGAQNLAIALKSNKIITTIDLSSNKITDVGAQDLAIALKSNKTLKKLFLHRNNITDAGGRAFANARKSGQVIKTQSTRYIWNL